MTTVSVFLNPNAYGEGMGEPLWLQEHLYGRYRGLASAAMDRSSGGVMVCDLHIMFFPACT